MEMIVKSYRGLRLVYVLNRDWMLTVSIIAGALAIGATVLAG